MAQNHWWDTWSLLIEADMMKRNRITIIMLLSVFGPLATAQQTPVFSQYYFNELVLNPAYAGAHVQLSLTSMYRNQWLNFKGAPQTVSLSGHTSLYDGRMGVGSLINVDRIGSYTNSNVYLYYAYKIHFNSSTLSAGVQGGFNRLAADYSKLDLVSGTDFSFQPLNAYKPNVGAGLYYNRKNFFAGFSVPYLVNNYASLVNSGSKIVERRYYFLRSGVILPLNATEVVKINPSILVRAQEGQPLSFDFNVAVIFYDAISAGASVRSGDALITFVDVKISESFHFAYSYDWTASALNQFSSGSHEFMLNYRTKVTQTHKNLACPDFFQYYSPRPKGNKGYNQPGKRRKRK
jgi:type IX secretion system PorP/SprF family membrane protein